MIRKIKRRKSSFDDGENQTIGEPLTDLKTKVWRRNSSREKLGKIGGNLSLRMLVLESFLKQKFK